MKMIGRQGFVHYTGSFSTTGECTTWSVVCSSSNSNLLSELAFAGGSEQIYLLMALTAGLAVQVKSLRPLVRPDILKNFQKRFFDLFLDFELLKSSAVKLPAVENKNMTVPGYSQTLETLNFFVTLFLKS